MHPRRTRPRRGVRTTGPWPNVPRARGERRRSHSPGRRATRPRSSTTNAPRVDHDPVPPHLWSRGPARRDAACSCAQTSGASFLRSWLRRWCCDARAMSCSPKRSAATSWIDWRTHRTKSFQARTRCHGPAIRSRSLRRSPGSLRALLGPLSRRRAGPRSCPTVRPEIRNERCERGPSTPSWLGTGSVPGAWTGSA